MTIRCIHDLVLVLKTILNKELNKKLSPAYAKGIQGRTTSPSKIRAIIRKKLEGEYNTQIGKELKLIIKLLPNIGNFFLKTKRLIHQLQAHIKMCYNILTDFINNQKKIKEESCQTWTSLKQLLRLCKS